MSEEEKLTTRKSKRLHSRIKEGFYADMDDSFDDSDVDDNEVSESDSDNEEDSDDLRDGFDKSDSSDAECGDFEQLCIYDN